MTPAEREAELARREENAAILSAKLERDRVALESEITTAAAASKAASAINRALQGDAAKRVKELEAEAVLWEAKLARLKGEAGKLTPAEAHLQPQESPAEKAAAAAEKAQLAADRAAFEAQKAAFERESSEAKAKLKAEGQALADLRAKL